MPERPGYLLDKDAQRRAGVTFNQRDDVRDLMKSPAGQNYGNMMDLQNQSIRQGGFESGDPRVDELKQARRQYNRQDKYNIADLLGYTPQESNEIYRQNSGVLREHAGPTYKEMYPISDMAHRVTGSGGLTGLLLKQAFGKTKKAGRDFFEDLRTMGSDILGGVGIGGALSEEDSTEEVLQNYADQTFPEEQTREEKIQTLFDEEQGKIDNFETDAYTDILDSAIENQWPSTKYEDYIDRGTEPMSLPFDEGKEDYIRRQNEYVSPVPAPMGIPNPQGDFDKFQQYPYPEIGIEFGGEEESPPPIVPYNDIGRETGIASMYGQGPKWGETDRRYEKEYRSHIERTGDRMTYDEFERAWERMHALPKGLHFQEPRAGRR